jgi:hypothetical protein
MLPSSQTTPTPPATRRLPTTALADDAEPRTDVEETPVESVTAVTTASASKRTFDQRNSPDKEHAAKRGQPDNTPRLDQAHTKPNIIKDLFGPQSKNGKGPSSLTSAL